MIYVMLHKQLIATRPFVLTAISSSLIPSFGTFHLFHLIWNLIAVLLGNILATLLRMVAALLSVDVLFHLLGLTSLFQFANLFLFIMTYLLFLRNRYSFSQLFTNFLISLLTILGRYSAWGSVALGFRCSLAFVLRC